MIYLFEYHSWIRKYCEKIQNRIHSTSSVSKICQNCKKNFTIEPDDFGFYERMKVSIPTWCPECRLAGTPNPRREYRYGEFFPLELSSFAYNESTAHEFFPIDSFKAEKQRYAWKKVEEKNYIPTISWKDLPNTIQEIDDGIIDEVILCESWDINSGLASNHNCTKAFRILSQELSFYKKMNIPIPRKCPNSRHNDRIQFRNPIKLWRRRCACDKKHAHHEGQCAIKFETSYTPNRPEIIYCEKCYQQEVY